MQRADANRGTTGRKRRTACAVALLAMAAPQASGHVTFRLPSMPGVSPGDAGGYVPLDGPFLSHSPFQLNVPHSMNGNTTVGLQCVVPQGLTITPQEIPGWTLTLTAGANGVPVGFTYQLNGDAASPGGFARGGQHLTNGMRSNIAFFLGISTAPGSCTFSDTSAYSIVGGYPSVCVQCVELSVDENVPLTPAGISDIASGRTQLYSLMWTATPSNAVASCSALADPATGNPLPGAAYSLDPWSAAAPSGSACTRWPCSTAAPFGGRSTAVVEIAGAPRISFIPRGCKGPSCVAPFPGGPFTGCPGGTVTMPVSVRTWASSPCRSPAASAGTIVPTTVGNAPAIPSPPPPAKPEEPMEIREIIIWLSIITAVFGCFCVSASAWLCARALGASSGPATTPAAGSSPVRTPPAQGKDNDAEGAYIHADAV